MTSNTNNVQLKRNRFLKKQLGDIVLGYRTTKIIFSVFYYVFFL